MSDDLNALVGMHASTVFINGDSQAVRIPADLAYTQSDLELEIERVGDELRISSKRKSLAGVLERFCLSHHPSGPKVATIRSRLSGMLFDGALYALISGAYEKPQILQDIMGLWRSRFFRATGGPGQKRRSFVFAPSV